MPEIIGGIVGLLLVVGLWMYFRRSFDKKEAADREQVERNGGPGPIKPK